jgi:glycosyltransferase involved in cell wall biosynthesis
MKIGIACKSFRQSGGMERYALDVVGALNRLGIKPTVFARRFDPALLKRFDIDAQLIRVGALPGKWRDHYFSRRVTSLKQQLGIDALIGITRVQAADIAICGGTHLGYLQSSNRAASWSDKRQIALEASHYQNAQSVVAHSQMMADELTSLYGVPKEKIALLYPPVDASCFSPGDAAERRRLRAQFGLPEDKTVFLFPSNSHERKGYPALEAFFEQTDLPVMLAVVGRSVSSTSKAIRYLGYQADMAAMYRAVDYTILASRYEPFGLVGIESILCGTPVALDRRIACTEILADHACLTFNSDRPGELADAIKCAVSRSQERARDCLSETKRHKGVGMPSGAGLDPAVGPVSDPVFAALNSVRLGLAYDPDIDRHVSAILALLPAVKAPVAQTGVGKEGAFRPQAAA